MRLKWPDTSHKAGTCRRSTLAGTQGCNAAIPHSQRSALGICRSGRQSSAAAPATIFLTPRGSTQAPTSAAHLLSDRAAPQPLSQWLGPSANPDLLAGLVTKMRQLQDVLIKKEQASSTADETETVKPGASRLPKLKGVDPTHFTHRFSGLGDTAEGSHA